MIGLDTTVLVRYIAQDDSEQSLKATALIENELSERNLGFITLIVLIELTKIMESCYEQDKDSIVKIVNALLTTKQIQIERADIAHLALNDFKESTGCFGDAIVYRLSVASGCTKIVSFDERAHSVGMGKV
jgi:predicted nucleic-acid-binding protein